jgi:tellurite resistance protein TerC
MIFFDFYLVSRNPHKPSMRECTLWVSFYVGLAVLFGTKEPYLVFATNAFALMGLRQLFFLIGGLLDKLVYLSVGLAVVLGFIGLKLTFEALHHDGVSWAPEIPILGSLAIIVGTLAVTTVASLLKSRSDRDKELGAVMDEAAGLETEEAGERG